MDGREKVINGLEKCTNEAEFCEGEKENSCPYFYDCNCRTQMEKDALELLKAQEPRVMTLEEVENLPYGHVLIETDKNDPIRWLDALLFIKNINFSFDFITLEGKARLLGTEYNREWRCWTARPTEEQRNSTPW